MERKEKVLRPQKVKIENNGRPAGLAKTRKIIMVEKAKEVQFMKMCAEIKFNDKRSERADNQRDERRLKRKTN